MIMTEFSAFLRRTAGAAIVLAGLAAVPAIAAEPTDVMARVGEAEITRAELDLAIALFAEQLAQVPEDQRESMVLTALIDMHLVADAARKDGLADTDIHKRRVLFLENQALRTAYVEEKVQKAITEDELRARYEKDIANYTPPEEVNAAHILVETEAEAKAILEDLAKGGDFAAIAKEKSKDPGSKDTGGDLGYFTKGQMVPEFEAEAFALPAGEVSKAPVQTQFGFHVIKVIDKRTQPVPPFETVRAQIVPVVEREKFEAVMTGLKAGTTIERFDTPPVPAADPAAVAPEGDPETGEDAEEPAPAQ
jgi:peptidyl-prolyl cis-trans isomerase C